MAVTILDLPRDLLEDHLLSHLHLADLYAWTQALNGRRDYLRRYQTGSFWPRVISWRFWQLLHTLETRGYYLGSSLKILATTIYHLRQYLLIGTDPLVTIMQGVYTSEIHEIRYQDNPDDEGDQDEIRNDPFFTFNWLIYTYSPDDYHGGYHDKVCEESICYYLINGKEFLGKAPIDFPKFPRKIYPN